MSNFTNILKKEVKELLTPQMIVGICGIRDGGSNGGSCRRRNKSCYPR
jgi:hypothetical protein